MNAAAAPDFRLYHSNALDVLAGLLATELATPVAGVPLLAPDTVLIPQAAMRRWLQATLAERHGVAANLEFLTPGEFVARALKANVGLTGPNEGDELGAETLRWRLYAALTDPVVLARPALAQIAVWLAGGDPLKPWSLAGELAGVFEKYQAWRRDWLLRWEGGADPDDPQAILWRQVAAGRGYRARRIQQYLDRFEAIGQPLPQGLPPRLFAFATLNVSPDVLRVLATQARVGTLHFYVPSPVKDYWGDLQRQRAGTNADDAATDNRLLQAWGAAGRDFMAVIGGYELVHPALDVRGDADPGEGGGPLHGSLLRRLQSDLFHRRAEPVERLPALRRDDPSLQMHACHTRLRELQVLHDQLRGLLEDPRFEPPLQPREIAVLAPDIDPYVPYLEAVFGAPGDGDRLPYSLADTSPLAGEPLADVFVRLLDLPVSRFGLNETLDLLASAPIAEAAGLDAPAFERLHAWLQAAGARWGLEAGHRAAHGAPDDDAYTWQFALDRLLLGHASGSDADIAGVAPWPQLEGSALEALDTLVRLLRVLARQQKVLGEAATPAQWRERLLGLLAALLPKPPLQAAGQRALDRLRALIDDFARQAETAGYDETIPAEVVRAHFAAALGEADTRAPLLTGGISFGRMVPMRLLPFRVICVLGMNDGDYPRRDPAAGLSKLTAELGTARRRHGDRSLREDDRFLFLQLFAAAQDVFYLSYLGADPRDGSLREPSVLVSELIDAAARQHADPAATAQAIVVQHPLQPFAPAAFGGDDEPRRFSYRKQWHPAADHMAATRTPLPPWFAGGAMPAADEQAPSLSIDALRRFLVAPAAQFLRQRLGLRLDEIGDAGEDVEPLLMPGRGRARSEVQAAVFQAVLRGDGDAATYAVLRARGLLPSGPLGRRTLAALRAETPPYARAFADWRRDAAPERRRIEIDLDGLTLHGTLADLHPHGLARVRIGAPNGNSAIRDGLDWLLASAAGVGLPLAQFHDGGAAGVGPHLREPLEAEQARGVLRRLLALRTEGLREPLPFAPYSGWDFFNAAPDMEKGLTRAAKKWFGSEHGWRESEDEALRLALRGRDLFKDETLRLRFVDLSMAIYLAVTRGEAYAGTDEAALRALAAAVDEEDAA
ncbi:exodeoxyribonuclease V subunit gamma [Pseudoxanthomonas kalamensis DSM 18571]|uniref:exodeoxyribonuclease V subunit gamma n=1 Tax=Pseudoxanthomonas kalamensis TaxID=289483 RepID=UPI0013917EFD|nr:exodeoxyribonuclease V subunit gamma [Pseudoxanthomonas kalamensis]KAF1712300.1 exodeoxyribonuclease V subunit gamma [Pseudoxanthomonas kalamensis DSM 18571]